MIDYFADSKYDIIGHMKAAFDQGLCDINTDGKIEINYRETYRTPWIHSKIDQVRECPKYHKYFFPYFKIIHSKCMECWKVVVKINNVTNLFKLLQYQKQYVSKTDKACKCGHEKGRGYVNGLYSGYFYYDSQEEGLEYLNKLKSELADIAADVYLKRACTEYELEFKDSEVWTQTDDQKEMEKILDDLLVLKWDYKPDPWYVELNTMRQWVEWAYEVGDESYRAYTNGKALFEECRKYDAS